MFIRMLAGVVAALFIVTAPASAHEVKIGSLTITNLWTRATPPKAPTGAGFLTITNAGTESDTLVSATSPLADKGEIHEMSTKDGVMKMQKVDGVEIPAGGSVTLAPGGFHIMFVELKDSFVDGGKVPVTLTFAKAGTVETFLHVKPIGSEGGNGHDGHDMKDMKMGTDH